MQDAYETMIRSIAAELARGLAPFSADEDFTEHVTRAVEAHLRTHPPDAAMIAFAQAHDQHGRAGAAAIAAAIEIGILTTI
ncbi:hypothetical protein [Acidocella facilis]|uniref:hypothetical protein n=1 Tax=Acidocella facilis TaxID=525 RepID=UPI00047CEEF6|nr:hypothetical protein [Acidocella facilis]